MKGLDFYAKKKSQVTRKMGLADRRTKTLAMTSFIIRHKYRRETPFDYIIMQKVVDTPNSELSVYFDAPMAAFNGNTATMPSSQDMPQDMPVPKPFSGAHQPVAYQLHDDGPVHAYDAGDNDNAQFESRVNGIEKDTRVATHPNGSEGWLPAIDGPRTTSPDKREGSIASVQDRDFAAHSRHPTAGTTYTNSESISSKKGYGAGGASLARTGSRKSTHTASDGRLIPGSAFVNGAGVTGPMATAERDEDLRVRGAEATANLTPKQKTKIAKDEGAPFYFLNLDVQLTFFVQ